MKIDKSKTPDRNRPWKDYGFDETKIDLTAGGKSDQLTLCPECSANRSKRKKHKCCSINVDYGVWHCHHCNASGYVPTRRELDARNQVLAVAREAVVRRSIRILVLDPLNSIMRDDEDKGQHHTLLRCGQRSLRALRTAQAHSQRDSTHHAEGVPKGSERIDTKEGTYLKTVDWRWFHKSWFDNAYGTVDEPPTEEPTTEDDAVEEPESNEET